MARTVSIGEQDFGDLISKNCFYVDKTAFIKEWWESEDKVTLGGYWKEIVSFTRALFNNTFKTNPYLERAVMTGITRVSKESLFSDLNNLNVVTTTSDEYTSCFGFTEEEVFCAMDEFDLEPSARRRIPENNPYHR